jgi:hypothetical protein
MFDGKVAMLGAFVERIDKAVLDGGAAEGDSERDRLFDVLMRRFEAMAPYRAGVRSLARSVRRDPALGCAMAMLAERSAGWMMAAAEISGGPLIRRVKRTGAAMAFAEAMRAWLDDDDPGLGKTMAALDRALRRGERVLGIIDDACAFVGSLRRGRDRRGDRAGGAAGEAAG